EVVGCVRHKCLISEVCWRGTSSRWCDPSRGVQPLDESGRRQLIATGGSGFGSSHRNLEASDGILRDERWVSGGITWITLATRGPHLAPYRARISRVLPGDANQAIVHHRGTSIDLKRVGAEEMGGELVTVVVEQGSLRREERIGDARVCGD